MIAKMIVCVLCFFGLFSDRVENIQARARCREIYVRKHEVVIKFTSEEDAKLFAQDMREFIKE